MTPTMTVLGLDVSIACTGWARLGYETGDLDACGTIETSPKDPTVQRMASIRRRVGQLIVPGTDVAIERGFVRNSGTVTDMLAGARWICAVTVYERLRVEPMMVESTKAKKLATGRGNAKKPEVQAAAVARWGERVDHPDIADAAWVAEVCRRDLHRQFPDGAAA